MSQNDFVVANADGATVRADINANLQALASLSSGASEPSTTYAYQIWVDTSNGIVKQRNAANTGWVNLYKFNGTTGLQFNWRKGADVSSASSLALGVDGNYFDVTGTTTITSIASLGVGTMVMLQFDAALTLTHNATDLVLPGGANITTAAGDHAIFVEYASGDWRCVSYQRASAAIVSPDQGELTISSGAITVTGTNHTIDTESDAASDDLDTINGGTDGQILIVRAENAARTVVLKDGTGNIETPDGNDIELDEVAKEVILKYDGATSDWHVLSSPAAGGGGAWELLATQTASSDATIDFISAITSTYDTYAVIYNGVTVGANASLYLRTSTDNGSSFDGGASDYYYRYVTNSGSVSGASTAAAQIALTTVIGPAAGESGNGIIYIHDPLNSSLVTTFTYQSTMTFTTACTSLTGSGTRQAVADVDALRFLLNTGNIQTGDFYLYGLKKS
jgi:hypothetical protein